MTVDQAFNDSISYYDGWMKLALPGFDDLFNTAVEIIPFDRTADIRVLDLGAGTGLFSKQVLQKYPCAHFDLYDLADKMLDLAKVRFADQKKQFSYVIEDYRQLKTQTRYNLVISSLSIHHINDGEKKALFEQIYSILDNGGVFINIDQIKGETQALRDLYWQHWLDQIKRSGAPESQIKDSIYRRTTYDQDALLSDQLNWIKEAGFVDADCVYKNFFVAVFYGRKEK